MQIPEGKPEEARTGLLKRLGERQAASGKRQASLLKVATALGIMKSVTKIRLHQTRAIDWVAQHMHGVDDDLLIGATQAVWRSGSAAAHAQHHFGVMRLDRNEVVRLRGDLDNDVGPALAAATMTLNEAFRIYDLRRLSHICT